MNTPDEVSPRLRTMRFITFAMLAGVVVFLAVALYLVRVQYGGKGLAPPAGPPVLTLVGKVFMVVCVVLSFALPAALARSYVRRLAAGQLIWTSARGVPAPVTEAGQLAAVWQTAHILGLALLEGPSWLAAIAYLVEGEPWGLALAAIGLCLILLRFPTESGLRRWVEERREVLERMRQEGA
jgi:hypothetical protein